MFNASLIKGIEFVGKRTSSNNRCIIISIQKCKKIFPLRHVLNNSLIPNCISVAAIFQVFIWQTIFSERRKLCTVFQNENFHLSENASAHEIRVTKFAYSTRKAFVSFKRRKFLSRIKVKVCSSKNQSAREMKCVQEKCQYNVSVYQFFPICERRVFGGFLWFNVVYTDRRMYVSFIGKGKMNSIRLVQLKFRFIFTLVANSCLNI